MDLYVVFSLLSVICSWDLCAVQSAPTGETPAVRHVRNKRCSCATFMDKECVYFCHLDIIWVNTPERIVSYGLGNAPRTRRAIVDSAGTRRAPRCRCVRAGDAACGSFCGLEPVLRVEDAPDALIRAAAAAGDARTGAKRKHAQAAAAAAGRINSSEKQQRLSHLAFGAALKTRLLLEKWRVR